eukprot:998269-Prymnesium_polylepis.1
MAPLSPPSAAPSTIFGAGRRLDVSVSDEAKSEEAEPCVSVRVSVSVPVKQINATTVDAAVLSEDLQSVHSVALALTEQLEGG